MAYLTSLGSRATLLDVFRSFPETSKPLIEFHEVLLRGPSPFTEAQRELIAAYVSGLNHCRYCHGIHTATAERLGIEEGLVPRLIEQFDAAAAPDRMKPVLHFARKLTEQPASATQADADAILAAGWDGSAIYHTVAVTALFNFMNRLVEGLGIEFDAAYAGESSRRLAEHGYLPLLGMLGR
ncbi:MAG: peroxidase-related enzyme [Woeseia sp.]